ncbi:uncharacterized protein LOC116023694 [Ipomoea triloba]|uniref:uncharacterized protein LOC116023694 n=1 Tax=Ipomoea triloba TaxID=35885 RepID=UPI00125CE5B3|nr:uncharacterized protein LOC116023694 [Ipomoea triloba]
MKKNKARRERPFGEDDRTSRLLYWRRQPDWSPSPSSPREDDRTSRLLYWRRQPNWSPYSRRRPDLVAFSFSSKRKRPDLVAFSKMEKATELEKKEQEGVVVGDSLFDRLLLVHSDLSFLVHQI